MAKSNYGPGIPADTPATQGPQDVAHREAAFFAQPSNERGIYVGFSDSAGSFGEGNAGASRGGRRPSMMQPQTTGPVSFKLKGRR